MSDDEESEYFDGTIEAIVDDTTVPISHVDFSVFGEYSSDDAVDSIRTMVSSGTPTDGRFSVRKSLFTAEHESVDIHTESIEKAVEEAAKSRMKDEEVVVDIPVSVHPSEKHVLEAIEELQITDVDVAESEDGGESIVSIELTGLFDSLGPLTHREHPTYYEPEPETLAGRVCQSIRDRIKETGIPPDPESAVTQLVIGEPQARVLNDHIESTENAPEDFEDWFGMEQVIVVPGPMIYPVIPDDE